LNRQIELAGLLRIVGINDEQMAALYDEAVQWADERMALMNSM